MKQGWEIKKLGDIAKFYRGLTYSKDDEVPSSTNMVLRSNNVDLETNALVYYDMKCLREDLLVDEDKKVKANSILICMSNGSKQHIGKVAYIQDDIDYAFGGFMGLIVPTKDIEGKYLYYLCVSHHFKHFLAGIGNGIGITNLRFSDLSSYCFPVPPIAEQEKIVAELDCLSGIIEKKKQQLKELDNLAQSIFYEMFVRESKNWEKMKLIDIYKFIDYRGKTPTKISEGIPLITARNIRRGYIDYSVKEYISEEEFAGRQSRGIAQKGDLLFTTEAPMGYVAIADLKVFSTGQRLITFQKKHTIDVNNTYVLHYLLSDEFQMELNNQATGATVKGIKGSKLEQMLIDCPPMQLQKDFASKIESIEKQKELIAQSIKETETLFNSRMDYYFN